MTFEEELEIMRAALIPFGAPPVVGLYWQTEDRYFNRGFIERAIATFEHRACCCFALGEKMNPLEQLGAMLLRSAAGLPSLP